MHGAQRTMTSFTSGLQALQGRTVNHDREWKVWLETSYAMHGHREWVGVADDWDDALMRAESAFPKFTALSAHNRMRPEYAVLDNPILAAFRADWYRPEDDLGQEPDVLDYWIGWLDHTAGLRHPPEQIEHARRVLAKLAALS